MKLEELQPNASVRGILPDSLVTVVNVQWFGSEALELTYKDPGGRVANQLLYRYDEPRLEIVEQGRPWSFDGDGSLLRLVSEAHRIRLAYLFDPVLAVHTSLVDPLPHQITAVYEAMLPRQPLRFLLADDPGAGKTIMAGLLIKELIVRGDLQRCLVVCPGSLVDQWQDELYRRFHLPFDILTNDKLEAARTGNWFLENNLVIARLDKLSRDESVQDKLKAPDCRWDLIVCDEAHKMSASFFGGEVKFTKRHKLGQMLSPLTRHFLLMTATPHNGKEEEFQLFMALIDGDRFEGRFRDGVHTADVSDLMRRMVKEKLLKFDGTPLFPERIAYTVPYKLSDGETRLYKEVTEYVREQFNRAEALQNDKRAGTVGFALTILQRRLASSPEAIYQSLRRRRERLEKRLRELELLQRGAVAQAIAEQGPTLDQEDVEDLDEAPDNEVAVTEEQILDQATAARTIEELKAEIATLQHLESIALTVRRSGDDRKWRELANLLAHIFTRASAADRVGEEAAPYGSGDIPKPVPSPRQKLVVFTEHRDTLNYLEQQISTVLGRKDAVVLIHGGMGREERKKAQESFLHDPEVQVLAATDAAGEGINLQRAHLMVNYDLPWNPNRIEQRFGRIHRIGQTEVCHLWNLVADETREKPGAESSGSSDEPGVETQSVGGIEGDGLSACEARVIERGRFRRGEIDQTPLSEPHEPQKDDDDRNERDAGTHAPAHPLSAWPPGEQRARVHETERIPEGIVQVERALAPRPCRDLPHRHPPIAGVRREPSQLLRAAVDLLEIVHGEVDVIPVRARLTRVAIALRAVQRKRDVAAREVVPSRRHARPGLGE